jgi:chromate transporter
MMEDEVVRRREWITRERFLDLLAATNLIPGPASTELAIHIGHIRAGWPGLLVAGTCFIVPAMCIVLAIAWAYVRFGTLPQAAGLLYGVKPVVAAVVAHALYGFLRTTLRTRLAWVLGVASLALAALGSNELVVLLVAGGVGALWRWGSERRGSAVACWAGLLGLLQPVAGAGAAGVGLWPLFLFFLKTGSVLYGSGYVLLAFIKADLVDRWGWLTEGQLLDAIAVGQVTPGPLFTTATFIGYVLGGLPGAVVATLGIFLPAFFFVAVSGPLVPRLRGSRVAGAFLDGVVVASLALMVVVTAYLGSAALVDVTTVVLAVASAILLFRFRVNSAWLVLGGAAIGLAAVWSGALRG